MRDGRVADENEEDQEDNGNGLLTNVSSRVCRWRKKTDVRLSKDVSLVKDHEGGEVEVKKEIGNLRSRKTTW